MKADSVRSNDEFDLKQTVRTATCGWRLARRRGAMCWLAVASLSLFSVVPAILAHEIPVGCLPSSSVGVAVFSDPAATQSIVGQTVVVGQTVYYQARLSHGNTLNCAVEGGHLDITTPDGATTNATLGETIPVICGTAGCPVGSVAEFKSHVIAYVVRSQDIGVQQSGVAACMPTSDGRIQVKATYSGGVSHCDGLDGCDPTAAISACNLVLSPCIHITKDCVNGSCENGIIQYSGIVSNCGNATLINITVTDTVDGVSMQITNGAALPPGGKFTYSSSYVATHTPSTNFVTAVGNDQIVGLNFSATTNAVCTLAENPGISVTKFCQNATAPGQPINFSGIVSNRGDVTLFNVTVTDDHAGLVFGPSSLAPGEAQPYTGFYTPTMCPSSNTVTATGTASPPACTSTTVTAQAMATCSIQVGPGISVTKNCQDGDVSNPFITFSGVVTNTGNVPLTNITVTDNHAGVVTNITSIPVGGSVAYFGAYTPADCGPSSDMVTATGSGPSDCPGGTNVSAMATAGPCRVVPGTPSISCMKRVFSLDDLDGNANDSHVTVPSDNADHDVTYRVDVTAGALDLSNVTISDPLLSGAGCTLPAPFSLAANTTTNFELCTVQFNCGNGQASCSFAGGPITLGAASGFAVLQIKSPTPCATNIIISAPATKIIGKVGIGPRIVGDLLKATIDGDLIVDPTAHPRIRSNLKVTGSILIQDLSQAASDAFAASAAAAALTPTQTYGILTKSITISSSNAVNVVSVGGINMSKQNLTIVGGPNDVFIFNVTGDFIFNGAVMVLSGGITGNNILWNILGTGNEVLIYKDTGIAYGTFLVPQRQFEMDHGTLFGSVIAGCTIKLHSGAFVQCPPGGKPPPVVNTITVTGQAQPCPLVGTTVTVTNMCTATVECQ